MTRSSLKDGATTIYLGLTLPSASSVLPDRRAGHPIAILFGLAAGGVYTAGPVTRTAVGSYPAISPLPVTFRRSIGGMLSVALSIGSHRLAVNQHRALAARTFLRQEPALGRIHRRPCIRLWSLQANSLSWSCKPRQVNIA